MEKARAMFTMALTMACIVTLFAGNADAKYRKRTLPDACEGATVKIFLSDTEENADYGYTVASFLDPAMPRETAVTKALFLSWCDPHRERYNTRLEGIVRQLVWEISDSVKEYAAIFGGTLYGSEDEVEAMDEDALREFLLESPTRAEFYGAVRKSCAYGSCVPSAPAPKPKAKPVAATPKPKAQPVVTADAAPACGGLKPCPPPDLPPAAPAGSSAAAPASGEVQ